MTLFLSIRKELNVHITVIEDSSNIFGGKSISNKYSFTQSQYFNYHLTIEYLQDDITDCFVLHLSNLKVFQFECDKMHSGSFKRYLKIVILSKD